MPPGAQRRAMPSIALVIALVAFLRGVGGREIDEKASEPMLPAAWRNGETRNWHDPN